MIDFLSGCYFAMTVIGVVFFARFYRESRDRLFLKLAAAFAILAVERLCLVALDVRAETQSFVYLLRLVAFVLIIWAMVSKSRREGRA